MNRRRLLTILILIVVAIASYTMFRFLGRGQLTVGVLPKHATVEVEGKTIAAKDFQDITLAYGSHTLVITAPGYKTLTTTVDLGWREQLVKTYALQVASLQKIVEATNPEAEVERMDVVQEKFFQNNTWAAGYLVPTSSERDIAVIVVRQVEGVWKPVLYSHDLPSNARQQLPADVYTYIAAFGEGE